MTEPEIDPTDGTAAEAPDPGDVEVVAEEDYGDGAVDALGVTGNPGDGDDDEYETGALAARPPGKPGKGGDKGGDKGKAGKGGKGKLVLSVSGVETALPPGHAIAMALAACGGTPPTTPLTVDAVRAVAPAPLAVCSTVTLRAMVAEDDDEVAEGQAVT